MAKKKSDGKGYKPCPNCAERVPSRTATCACGHIFAPKVKTVQASKTADNDLKSVLLAEKAKLENLLQNRKQMEDQLKSIDNLLKTL